MSIYFGLEVICGIYDHCVIQPLDAQRQNLRENTKWPKAIRLTSNPKRGTLFSSILKVEANKVSFFVLLEVI